MGWNGFGVVVRETPVASGTVAWQDTKAAGDIQITTADHDFHDQDLAAAIQNTIAKDGQNTPTNNLSMGNFRHTNVGAAVAFTDYASLGQVYSQSPMIGSLNTSADIATAVATGTFTSSQVIVSNSATGRTYRIAGFSQAVNMATTGAGGMDTGLAPISGYVAIYAIYNPTTATQGILAVDTTSATAPYIYGGASLPAGYTASALLSVWPTDASRNFIVGSQTKNTLKFAILYGVVLNGSNTQHASPIALSVSSALPKNAIFCDGTVSIASTVSSALAMGLYTNAHTSPALTTFTGSAYTYGFSNLMVTTAQQILYTATAGSGTMTASIALTGYTI